MNIESLVYRPIQGGIRSGLFSLELRLGGSDAPQFASTELVGRIMQATGEKDPRSRILTIKDWGSDNEPWEVMELVSSLKDSYTIISDTTGYQKPGWLTLADYKRVWIGDADWLMYHADEIYYQPNVEGSFHEPKIPANNLNSMRYVVLSGRGSSEYGETLMAFLRQTELPWMILPQAKTTYEVQIL
jgi:hypothetical protein